MDYVEVYFRVHPLMPGREILVAQLAELDYESFADEANGLKAYVPFDAFRDASLRELPIIKADWCTISYDWKKIKRQNWNKIWEDNFEPIQVGGRCLIRAPFHQAAKEGMEEVIIEPKMAFGTGHHATTWQMVNQMLDMELQGKQVLDMGSGTGVLAILAEKKGAEKVLAVDMDEWACTNTIKNLQHNNCVRIEVEKGGSDQLAGRAFDVILANINKNVLLANMSDFIHALKTNGILLLSGFFNVDCAAVKAAAEAGGLHFINRTEKEHWATLCMQKGSCI